MLFLTALERAALDQICGEQAAGRAALATQLATAKVSRRENSGSGFFTDLVIDKAAPPVRGSERVVGNVVARIEGFTGPLFLMLFMEEGYAVMLEGATVEDSTSGLDLAALRFEIELPE